MTSILRRLAGASATALVALALVALALIAPTLAFAPGSPARTMVGSAPA